MDWVLIIIVLGAAAGGFVQGLSGFAFGLVAMSFWAWAVEPQQAAVLSIFGGLTGQTIAALTRRRRLDLKLLAPYLAGGLAGIPVGMALLPHLDIYLFKFVLGALLVIWCPFMLFADKLPAIKSGGRWADGAIGALGGVLGGIGGFTGTIPTLWCTLQRMDKTEQRAVVQNFNLATLAFTLTAYVATGRVHWDMAPRFAVVALCLLIPVLLGAKIYIGLSEARFRQLVLALLTASGVALISASVPRLLG